MGLIKWIKSFRKPKLVIPDPIDELIFFRQYTSYGSYSNSEKFKKEKVFEILAKFRDILKPDNKVSIESKFNNLYYPIFDLDDQSKLDLFKQLYAPVPYALFKTSADHYWGILDTAQSNLSDIFLDHNWKICNDDKYTEFSKSHRKLFIRGLYEDDSRKPHLYHINGDLSKNFQLFINKVCIYYNKEGLELSVLRYKNPKLLIKFNRKLKLEKINGS